MRISIYQNGEVHVPDPLLGFVGETNHRKVDFDFVYVNGATAYTLRIDYPDGTAYSVPITNKSFTVTGSMLPAEGKVKAQWQAYATTTEDNETVYTLVAKSRIFELEIGASLDDTVEPIPPYEKSVEAAETLVQVGENFEQGYVTEIKEFINAEYFKVGVGTTAQIADMNARGAIPENGLCIPTDGTDVERFEQALEDIEDLQGDVSDLETATADTGWQTVTAAMLGTGWSAGSEAPKYRKIGKRVWIKGEVTFSTEATANATILTMPEGYRAGGVPPKLNYGTGYKYCEIRIYSDGQLQTTRGFDFTNGCTVVTSFGGVTIFLDFDYFVG